MSTTTKIELAVEIAERSITNDGHGHGPCLSVRLVGDSSKDQWEVEFAYEGLADRSPTTDPSSIVLLVDLKTEEVTTVSLM
jgi:hypothetical protein